MPVIPTLRRQKQEDHKFKASQSSTWDYREIDPASKTKTKTKKSL
jgi:hypothetical protein